MSVALGRIFIAQRAHVEVVGEMRCGRQEKDVGEGDVSVLKDDRPFLWPTRRSSLTITECP